jgi:putative DNA primase/helicase
MSRGGIGGYLDDEPEDTGGDPLFDKVEAEPRKTKTKSNGNSHTEFKMGPRGLFFRNEDGEETFLSGPFKTLAVTRDALNNFWGLLLSWRDPDGHEHLWSMPKALLAGDGSEVRRMLVDGGLEIATSVRGRSLLTTYLMSQRSDNRARAVSVTGWHGGQYVFPDSSIGEGNGESAFFQTEHIFNHRYAVRGTLQEWKDNVARLAEGNSRIVFAMSVSLASILMEMCSIESCGFHLHGGSSKGKTTTITAAGSAWGGGGINGFVISWRATSNGMEGIAAAHNHACIPLDEFKQASGKDVGETVYMLANGSGKNRSDRSGHSRKAAEWRLFYLSSGEITLAAKMAEDNRLGRPSAGQEVRFVEIPFGSGFENIHNFLNAQDFADGLKEASKTYYGAASRAFIEAVAGDLGGVAAAVKQGMAAFETEHCPQGADSQTTRVLHKFAFVAACGELAIGLGILPWPPGEAANAAKICFDAWIAARGGVEPAEVRNAVRAIQDFVSAHGNSRFLAAWEPKSTNSIGEAIAEKIINLAGYKERNGEGWDFYFTPGAWREALAGLDPKTVARALADKGLLEPGDEKHLAESVRVPSYGRLRLYHIKAAILEAAQ